MNMLAEGQAVEVALHAPVETPQDKEECEQLPGRYRQRQAVDRQLCAILLGDIRQFNHLDFYRDFNRRRGLLQTPAQKFHLAPSGQK